jgi:DNA repair ATPase RecN
MPPSDFWYKKGDNSLQRITNILNENSILEAFDKLENDLGKLSNLFCEYWEETQEKLTNLQEAILRESTLADKIKYEINNVKFDINIIKNNLKFGFSKDLLKSANEKLIEMAGHLDNIQKAYTGFIRNNDTVPMNLYTSLTNLIKQLQESIKDYNTSNELKLLTGPEAMEKWKMKSEKDRTSLIDTWMNTLDYEKRKPQED